MGAGAGAGGGGRRTDPSTPPQSIEVSLTTPKTLDCGMVLDEVRRLERKDWVQNPFYVCNNDWTHVLSMAVTALKAFVHEDDRGFLDGLSEDTFWEFLRPLVKGRTHSGKDRAKELVTDITGIPDGGVQPIKEKHVRLQNAHDLPRYLLYEEEVRGYQRQVRESAGS